MSFTHTFPYGGYEIKVLHKQDVLDCIDNNIIDKEIALEVIKNCEIDATNFLKEGRWAGIPFIGNIRIPKLTQKLISDEVQSALSNAKETMDTHSYLLFKKAIEHEAGQEVDRERRYKYLVSKFVGKNPKYFKYLSKKYGAKGARIICFTFSKPFMIYEQLQTND